MAIRINGKIEIELERELLKKMELNRKKKPDIFCRIEIKDRNFLSFLLDFFKVGKK